VGSPTSVIALLISNAPNKPPVPLGRVSRKYLFKKCIMNGLIEELNDRRALAIGIGYLIASLFSFLIADYGTNPIGVGIGVAVLWFFFVIFPLLLIYGGVWLGCKYVLRYRSARECEEACLGIDACIEECRLAFRRAQ